MYEICKGSDGKYHCMGRLQDGTERWTEDTLDEAVASLKKFAKVMNGTKLKRKNIGYYEEAQVVETKYVEKPIPRKVGK